MINFYWQGALIGDDANEKMVIFIIPESQFVLGYPNKNSKTYNKHRRFCTLYNKSNIKNFLTHHLTYMPLDLDSFIVVTEDSRRLAYKHTIKANSIIENYYEKRYDEGIRRAIQNIGQCGFARAVLC